MSAVLGIDAGTSGCRVIAINRERQVLALAAREYAIDIPGPGLAEQDPENIWQTLRSAILEVLERLPGTRIDALSFSVQGEAIMPLGADGLPLGKAILGMDTRARQENNWLKATFGETELLERTGMPIHTVNTLPKVLWLMQNRADIWPRVRRLMLYEDFFIHRLGADPMISACLASRTQCFNTRAGEWDGEILSRCGIDPELLSPVADGRPVHAAKADGLPLEGALIVPGGHDQACAALGAGAVSAGLATVSTGTAEVVTLVLDAMPGAEVIKTSGASVYRHVVPGKFLAMTLNHNAGSVIRWFRDTFCQEDRTLAEATDRDVYDVIFASASDGPAPLVFVPYLGGGEGPDGTHHAGGAVLGLTLGTRRSDIATALMEALTFDLRGRLERLEGLGAPVRRLSAVGGGARSTAWVQMKSDVCRKSIAVAGPEASAAMGAAILAAVGAGYFPDAAAAISGTAPHSSVEPDEKRSAVYDLRYRCTAQATEAIRKVVAGITDSGRVG